MRALLFGVGHAAPARQETLAASTCTRRMPRCSPKTYHDLLGLASRSRPLSTKMHVSWSPIARCDQRGGHRAESTPPEGRRSPGPWPTWARMRADGSHRRTLPVVQLPAQPHTSIEEIAEQSARRWGVHDLGVELQADQPVPFHDGATRRVVAWRVADEAVGQRGRPRRRGSSTPGWATRQAGEIGRGWHRDRAPWRDGCACWPYSRWPACVDLAAKLMGQQLHAVADAQDGLAGQALARTQRRAWVIDAGRPTRQDEPFGLARRDRRQGVAGSARSRRGARARGGR